MAGVAVLGTFLLATFGALAGTLLVLPFGLVVVEQIVYPLAAAVGALLAALGAGWAATLLARDGTCTRLLPVVGATEAVALVVAALVLAYLALDVASRPRVLAVTPFTLGLIGSLLLGTAATVAAWRLRAPRRSLRDDARLTVLLVALALAAVPLMLFLAGLAGLAGA
jgi:small-conductance mechanosensitive channel